MAKKRKSSEIGPMAQQHPTSLPAQQLDYDLATFCRDAEIDLLDGSPESKAKSYAELKGRLGRIYKLLWWRNKPALDSAIGDFFRALPTTPDNDSQQVKLNLLLEKLKHPAEETKVQCTTPASTRVLKTVLEPTHSDDPPSPSPAPRKDIRGHFPAAKPARPGFESNNSFYSAKMSLPPKAVETSFATTATKSFGLSFQSSAASGAQDTAATSFSSVAASPKLESAAREPDYFSSLSTTEAGDLIRRVEEAESSQNSLSNNRTARRRRFDSPSPRDTQTTWGSSIASTIFDEGQRDVDHFFANGYEWQTLDNRMVRDDDTVMEDERVDSPKRQKVDYTNARFDPALGFAQFMIPEAFSGLPFQVQWEAQRLLQAGVLTVQDLQGHWSSLTVHRLYDTASRQEKPFYRALDHDPVYSSDFDGLTFTAKLQFAKLSSGVLFDMKMQAPSKGSTSDLQRRFGCDSVLYVDMPSLNKLPDYLNGKDFMGRFREMAETPQTFLGRRWFLLLAQAHKKRKKSDLKTTKPGASRLVFVAIDTITIPEVISYMVPYFENAGQEVQKLYSRFELFVSASTPAVTFEPREIHYRFNDQCATSDAADNRFLDPLLEKDFKEPIFSKKEMSDGCCEISYSAMCKVAEALGTEVPAAIQCRIAGSKGIWYRARDPNVQDDEDCQPSEPQIKIANTQIKVKRNSLFGCHSGTLTLNVLKANSSARTSLLHIGFLPILLDRGVPRETIFAVIHDNIKNKFEELDPALTSSSPMLLRRWMHSRNELWEERARNGGIQTVNGFPKSREEKIVHMLETGSVPRQDIFLANEVRLMIEDTIDIEHKKFKIPLARSTTLTGIADPLGCLQPGEVHVDFSAPFRDRITGSSWIFLQTEGLIARNPAMAPWDIQKIRFVFRPELAYLGDLAVLSAKGKRPLAELLQGGDYDGDTFWLRWEPKLVAPFKNAPAPWKPPPIEFFGIKKDARILRDVVRNPKSEAQWCKYLSEMATTRLRFNPLGTVTRLHDRLIYLQGGISSREAILLVHLHDYLVDADKQGYVFDDAALQEFKRRIQLPTNLPLPRHWEFTKIDDNDNDNDTKHAANSRSIGGNIIDEVFFKVIKPLADQTLNRVKEILSVAEDPDPHLYKFFDEMQASADADPLIHQETEALERAFSPIRDMYRTWRLHTKDGSFDELIMRMRTKYDNIQPVNTTNPRVLEWLRRQGHDLTTWERFKASALAKLHYNKRAKTPGRFVYALAGRELCIIKHHEVGLSHALTEEAWCNLKISKRPRQIEVIAGDEDGEDDTEAQAIISRDEEDDQMVAGVPNERGGYF